jgi:effector-binding domain-containing protein
MSYEVTLRRTRDDPTAVVRAVTTWREFPGLWPALLNEVWAFLRITPGLRNDGHNVMLYRDRGPDDEVAVEVGVQVTRAFDASGRVVPSVLPGAEAAVTVHSGSPDGILAAHEAVRAWCVARGKELTGVRWEIYGDPDPRSGHFDVEVYWQLA